MKKKFFYLIIFIPFLLNGKIDTLSIEKTKTVVFDSTFITEKYIDYDLKLDSIKKLNVDFTKAFKNIDSVDLAAAWCAYLSKDAKILRGIFSFSVIITIFFEDGKLSVKPKYYNVPVYYFLEWMGYREHVPVCKTINVGKSKSKFVFNRHLLKYLSEKENNEFSYEDYANRLRIGWSLGANWSTINVSSLDIAFYIGRNHSDNFKLYTYGTENILPYLASRAKTIKLTESIGLNKLKSSIGYHFILPEVFFVLVVGAGVDLVHFYDWRSKQNDFGVEVSLNAAYSFNLGYALKNGFYLEIGL